MEGWVLVIEDLNGTHHFPCDPQLIEDALLPYREHVAEGESVRREFEAAGRISWEQYRVSQTRMEPDLWDEMRESADLMRKQYLENRDPGDETNAA